MFEDKDSLKEMLGLGGFVGLAQINLVAGDLEYNYNKICDVVKKSDDLGLDAISFPKNTLIGFDMSDYIARFPFLIENQFKYLQKIADNQFKTPIVISFLNNEKDFSIAIIRNGAIGQIVENKDFITSKLLNDGVEYYIKPTSISSRMGSQYEREQELIENSKTLKRPILEINQVGAIDCWSYSGQSLACDENGNIFARAKAFEEQLLIVNPFRKIGNVYSDKPKKMPMEFSLDYDWDLERVYKSTVQAIRDYFNKCGLKRAVLGLSGGLDSTVSAVLVADAIGKENVYGVSMPSKLTSIESKSDAKELAENLGIGFCEISIKPMVETSNSCFGELFDNVEKIWTCRYKQSFTQDNIQARSRAMYLWGIANEFESCIPIATSDKSEAYMGYATINGDMSGGFAPIADITKTKLFALARWINKNRFPNNSIPESVILKRPGAELAIDPNTGKTLCAEDALMPYEFLDEVIWRIENKHENYTELLNSSFLYEIKENFSKEQKKIWLDKFFRRMATSVYKWSILPPSVIIDSESINKTDYQIPITSARVNFQ